MNRNIDLLVIYHSQSGNTERMALAVADGARRVEGVRVRTIRACDAKSEDLATSRCLVLCSPEYFGYMAGAVKDLFDRTYEEIREVMLGKSYTIVVSAGNDGSGALQSIERIVAGFKLRKVQEPIVNRGDVSADVLENCRQLGQTLAAGLELGIY